MGLRRNPYRLRHKLENQVLLRCDEFKAYSNALYSPSHDGRRKLILFANYRSGSTLLGTLLNCHPAIFCDGEIFLKFSYLTSKLLSPRLYINGCVDYSQCNTIYGFDLKVSQFERVNCEKLYGSLRDNFLALCQSNWAIVYLRRHNLFRLAISSLVARLRKQWHIADPTIFQPVAIEPADVMRQLCLFEKQFESESTALKDVPHLKLSYHLDLLSADNHQHTSDKVFAYLGLESFPVQTTLLRTSADRLADSIVNYDEIIDVVGRTKFAHFLGAHG